MAKKNEDAIIENSINFGNYFKRLLNDPVKPLGLKEAGDKVATFGNIKIQSHPETKDLIKASFTLFKKTINRSSNEELFVIPEEENTHLSEMLS